MNHTQHPRNGRTVELDRNWHPLPYPEDRDLADDQIRAKYGIPAASAQCGLSGPCIICGDYFNSVHIERTCNWCRSSPDEITSSTTIPAEIWPCCGCGRPVRVPVGLSDQLRAHRAEFAEFGGHVTDDCGFDAPAAVCCEYHPLVPEPPF